ncbi:GlxA family transcriptional regulator [Stackebrandtia nassauensis]|uniref:Transcriptional regulator, AraC family n=1 Tax=Stackebrandtia nassauensis (strain DSM 44728 / CIP 108903 / NRRL B-16338 / NBRC 102104 / LLR-40K-21) TaxID=446470 RepID=D3Q4I7_STANL|nr:helix-turn-helix domain-containing protein [Stackebrandtia nassauensis]ADD40147.1 transcriptional regulator, AraC family [Stackebrandtia nassauensis DSM 44728]
MKRHRVVALVNEPQSPFELASAAEVFGGVRPDVPRHYDFRVCAEHPGPVATTVGYPMLVDAGLAALRRADTVVIPGWQPHDAPVSAAIIAALRSAHRRGARIAAICTGAFVLARTGLLDGRRATTHWRHTAELAADFPELRVDRDVLFVDHGDVATSAGTGAGIDLCLHLVRSDHGAAYAAQIALNMVLPPHREGSQLQYATRPAPVRADESLAPVLEWASTRLHNRLTVGRLAEQAGLSERTLARRFAEQLGVSPGQWLLGQRLDAARVLLESSDLPVDAIVTRVGLASAVNLRRRFRSRFGTTPGGYRRAFGEGRRLS